MILISHRGNVNGPNKKLENKISYLKKAINIGFDVEVDVWHLKGLSYLGHDKPQYRVSKKFLKSKNVWCHAKNLEALIFLKKIKAHFFWHEKDQYTITSNGFVWTYPGKRISKESIVVLPEIFSNKKQFICKGICSDYILNYRKFLND